MEIYRGGIIGNPGLCQSFSVKEKQAQGMSLFAWRREFHHAQAVVA